MTTTLLALRFAGVRCYVFSCIKMVLWRCLAARLSRANTGITCTEVQESGKEGTAHGLLALQYLIDHPTLISERVGDVSRTDLPY